MRWMVDSNRKKQKERTYSWYKGNHSGKKWTHSG